MSDAMHQAYSKPPFGLASGGLGLSHVDLAGVVGHLEKAVAIFDRTHSPLNGAEIRAKSVLSAIRRSLTEQLSLWPDYARPEPPLVAERHLPIIPRA